MINHLSMLLLCVTAKMNCELCQQQSFLESLPPFEDLSCFWRSGSLEFNIRLLTRKFKFPNQHNIFRSNRSIFGEDALANLSIEKPLDAPDATVTGHIRIRAKSQVTNK